MYNPKNSPNYNYMFDFQLGEALSIKETSLEGKSAPFLLVGNPGQGRSVFLVKFILELIKNRQSGILYDPYGDLAKKIFKYSKSDEVRDRVSLVNQDDNIDFSEAQERLLLIHGNLLEEGLRASRSKVQDILESSLSVLDKDNWLLVDEAFKWITDDLFDAYLNVDGPRKFLSCQELFDLSSKERQRLFAAVQGVFVYKPRNLDAQWLAEYFDPFDVKSIAAIKQFCFQYLYPCGESFPPEERMMKPGYDNIPWPLKDI